MHQSKFFQKAFPLLFPGQTISISFIPKKEWQKRATELFLEFSCLVQGIVKTPDGITVLTPGMGKLSLEKDGKNFFYCGVIPDIDRPESFFLHEKDLRGSVFPVEVAIGPENAECTCIVVPNSVKTPLELRDKAGRKQNLYLVKK